MYAQLVQFPRPSDTVLWIILFAFFALIVGAVLMEYGRRNKTKQSRLRAEWDSIEGIALDRGLTKDEDDLLKDVLAQFARSHPLNAVTTRQGFERCASKFMAELETRNDRDLFEQRGEQLREIRTRLGLELVPIGHPIHTTRDLHAGQWMSVTRDVGGKEKWFRMMVSIVDEAYFFLKQHPSSIDIQPDLEVGVIAKCRMWRDEDARYFFSSTVARIEKAPKLWCMTHSSTLDRSQAREHFRVRHDQTVTIGILNAPVDGNMTNLSNREPVTKIRARITSLSAGGLAAVVGQPVSKQVLLRVPITLPNEASMSIEARIISCEPVSGGRYLVRAAFAGMSEEDRDAVAHFVSRKQQFKLSETTGKE